MRQGEPQRTWEERIVSEGARTNGTHVSERWSQKKVFTTGEAAELCKVSQQTIIRCFDSGRLNGFRVPGSRFRRIPRDELIRFMRANDIPTDALGSATRTILVVDDHQDILDLFQDALSVDDRYEVHTATNGYEAGILTEQLKPSLIVLDYMLPDINGDVVCQRIRNSPELAGTKVLFISGVVSEDELRQLTKAGADDFIKKPFDINQLLAKVEALIGE